MVTGEPFKRFGDVHQGTAEAVARLRAPLSQHACQAVRRHLQRDGRRSRQLFADLRQAQTGIIKVPVEARPVETVIPRARPSGIPEWLGAACMAGTIMAMGRF